MLNSRLAKFSKEERGKFLEEWIANDAQLGWLIDADTRTVFIYRSGAKPEELKDANSIAGKGPVAGYALDLEPIWRGL